MEEAPKSGLSRSLEDVKQPLAPGEKREMSISSTGGSVHLGSFYFSGCQVIFCLPVCISGLITSLWQCWKWLWLQPSLCLSWSPGEATVISSEGDNPFQKQQVCLPRTFFFLFLKKAFLLQKQSYPESSELQKEMLPILPEAGSNYQPLIKRHEDAEVLLSYRHMGISLKSAANFNGMVHMPEAHLVCSFLPEDWS